MSRCKACDKILSESELKRKDYNTDDYLDLCYGCARVSNDAILNDLEDPRPPVTMKYLLCSCDMGAYFGDINILGLLFIC